MESLKGFKRTSYCGDLRPGDIGREISVCGWVQRRRDLGQLIFVDLRDRTGLLQLAFDEQTDREVFKTAFSVRAEFVLAARGKLRERSAKNKEIPTGEVELEVTELRILAAAETPPFEITDQTDVNDTLRLKYRYLDLRRPAMQRAIALRHKVVKAARDYFDENGFFEIETPVLTKSTPEGARDYLVPSRVHPGKFYALPQSPQQYKQLLMLAGFDRYFQIARCFRDEDLRADRQPEFTQIDLEMSFVDVDDVVAVNEGFLKTVFENVLDIDIETPIPRMTYAEAMARYGSDKPDTRFGLELCDLSELVKNCAFKVFADPIAAGGSVRAVCVPGGASQFPRKQIDALVEFVKTYGAKGLAWMRLGDDGMSSSFAKFMTDEESAAILRRVGAGTGDLVLIVADANDKTVFAALGALRCECARKLGLMKKDDFRLLWVTEFPMFEYSEEEGRYVAMHHPFTAPMDEDVPLLETDKKNCRAKAYDIVLNGTELGGGSIRISTPDMQRTMFSALGFTEEDAEARFGHLIGAFKYGAPPHGGLAYGLDRLVMLLSGADSIRDVIAFPKVQNASEPMTACPDAVDQKQLDELGIAVKTKTEQ
jgi:aspartyl-tRNA synthetase